MEEYESEGPKPWHMYTTSSEPNPSRNGVDHREGAPKNVGSTSSMSAISFGFVATAVLISMFLIMAIFEHLFRPNTNNNNDASFVSPQNDSTRYSESRSTRKKPQNPHPVSESYGSDFSVMMPGQHYPTYIAQPAPLPCPREGAYWPSHQQFAFP